ncbi:MAG: N-acetylmuramoyl-L-alanine amidase, partial [Dinghuibacter sp.]|nr:N-acetylmuramoyl-L-alanine amidase [Dinghuibacter sp.]
MKRIFLFFTVLFILNALPVFAQKNYAPLFERAYNTYPNIPRPALEAMAWSASRLQPVQTEDMHDHHGKPERTGLFALVADGKNYFRNSLSEVASKARTSTTAMNDVATEIMAVAGYISGLCRQYQVQTLNDLKPVLQAFCEIPATGSVNAFARDSWLYEIYYHLEHGFEKGDIRVLPQTLAPQRWFTEENLKVLQSPRVTISNGEVTGGGAVYNDIQIEAVTDYPPALWVTSPNFSSRGTTAISAVTIHTMQGSYSGSISWFQNTASQVSAHYMIRSSDGQVTQMVREASKAWHVGSENPYTIGLEHEGFVNDASWYTTAMYNSSAALTKDICTDNGIATTACYNGASSSGVVVLSSTIKIKGHQHYPNQSHTDPGINWDWPRYYNLLNPAGCAATTTLNASFVSTAFANLNWSAVSGAASYTLEWKTTAATTWNVVNSTTNYRTIAGLAASTSYNWRVKTNCSNGGVSGYSATQTFTTKASCWDGNEPNNVYTSPSTYNLTGFTYGKICASGDVDFYRITTTAAQNITFKLQTLPKNYNIETYTGTGTYLAGGYAAGTADETVTLVNRPAGSYLFRVYGATSTDNDAINDYRLQVTLSAPTARVADMAVDEEITGLHIFPNPVQHLAQLNWNMTQSGTVRITVTDYYNRNVYARQFVANTGMQRVALPTTNWKEGMYVVQITHPGGTLVQRMMVV